MLRISQHEETDLSLLDPEKHAPLNDRSRGVRDAYTDLKRARAALKRANQQLIRTVQEYARERHALFLRLLKERKLGCCLCCDAIVSKPEIDWLLIQHIQVTNEGHDVAVSHSYMVRACATCRREPEPGAAMPFYWVQQSEVRASFAPARKMEDGTFQILEWPKEASPNRVWGIIDTAAGQRLSVSEEPVRTPRNLPEEIREALPPAMDLLPKNLFFDRGYLRLCGHGEGIILISDGRQEEL